MRRADVLVIGSGPAGSRAAVDSARLDPAAKVVLVERKNVVGGACVNTGTIPSKTLRQAAMDLAGWRRGTSGRRRASGVTQRELLVRVRHVVEAEIAMLRAQIGRVGVELVQGEAALTGPHEVVVRSCEGAGTTWEAGTIVIACGTEAVRTPGIPYDSRTVVVPDELFDLPDLPRSMTILGGGVIGSEYACIYGLLGVDVTLVDSREQPIESIDGEIWMRLAAEMRRLGVTLALGERAKSVERLETGGVVARCASGRVLASDVLMTASGRAGRVEPLGLAAAGLAADARGRIAVDSAYRTSVPHILAVGDIVGFPSLASTAMEQGRIAACAVTACPGDKIDLCRLPSVFPFGIYTIPEIAMVGRTEERLRRDGAAYEAGRTDWSETARGQILGDDDGMLKLLWRRDTREILGVHIIGDGAADLVHLGQAVMALGGTVDYFVESVFNYPTLAEAYKLAVRGVPARCRRGPA